MPQNKQHTLYVSSFIWEDKSINCRAKPFLIPLWFLSEIKTSERPRICLQRPSTIFFPHSPIIETTSYYFLVSDFVPHSYRISITIDEHSIPTAPFSSYRNDSKYRPYSSFSAITIFGPVVSFLSIPNHWRSLLYSFHALIPTPLSLLAKKQTPQTEGEFNSLPLYLPNQ